MSWFDGDVLGPVLLPDGVLTMRPPRLADGPAWSAARLANRDWLERAFPAWGTDWAAEQTPAAWAERCWRLRAAARRGDAMPFVVWLDGRLIGELGMDAVDRRTGTGEAAIWAVRDHGSAHVVNVASLLLLEFSLNGHRPLQRVLSPVSTSARRGRSPGLTALGFTIEATVWRPVGTRLVEHDLWVLDNTREVRDRLATQLRSLTPAPNAPDPDRAGLHRVAGPAARAALRVGRRAVDQQRRPQLGWRAPHTATASDGTVVAVRPETAAEAGGRARWLRRRLRARQGLLVPAVLTADGRRVGSAEVLIDPGTGTAEITVVGSVSPAVALAALELMVAAAPGWRPGLVAVEVRVPDGGPGPDALQAAGFTPAGTDDRPGRRRWRATLVDTP